MVGGGGMFGDGEKERRSRRRSTEGELGEGLEVEEAEAGKTKSRKFSPKAGPLTRPPAPLDHP